MDLRFGLVTLNPFPIGNVSTVRYSSYCKALAKRGVFSKVYVTAPSKTASPNLNVSGVDKGVFYEYVCGKITWEGDPSVVVKVFYYLYGLLRTALLLKRDRVNCVLLYSGDFVSYFFIWLCSLVFPFVLVTDKSEYPYGYARKGRLGQAFQRLKLKVFDGFVVMTKELVEFYQRVKAKKADVFFLPMTVDSAKFDGVAKNKDVPSYIACVFGVHNRDGLLDTVKAYGIYKNKLGCEAMRLWLIGDFTNLISGPVVAKYIVDNNLCDDVVLKGVLPHEFMPQALVDASCLITTALEYTSGGFPTKLGEYLLSGTPVVTTSAGEISLYLRDRVDAFVSTPGDVEGVANSLIFVHENENVAKSVAKRGRELALSAFNADSYVSGFASFLKERYSKKYGQTLS